VMKIERADDILRAKQEGKIGFLPTVEHLAIGGVLERLDVLYGMGVRLGGITYSRRNAIGDGQNERTDAGLSSFGVAVVRRMNDLGMVIDVSHAGFATAMDAIEHSRAPVVFSHNAAYTLRPTARTRKDEELVACAQKGGLIGITAVPNSLSDDPEQDIACVLDHYDYMVRLVGVDHVAIGTDTLIGDHVGYHIKMMARGPAAAPTRRPAKYLNGLESPADGTNIIRGLIARGHSDVDIAKIAGGNALRLFREVIG
jgi:membrane dipeptidase